MKIQIKIEKVYVIYKDKDGNLHQGHITESNAYYVKGLVDAYPNNNFTKDCVEDLKKIMNQI